jgi:hypothetical protein
MNLLLDSEFSLKIADFGHSCAYTGPKGRGFAGAAGTNSYMVSVCFEHQCVLYAVLLHAVAAAITTHSNHCFFVGNSF